MQSSMYGAFGPEGQRMREQFWLIPSGDPSVALRATVFRPAGGIAERHPLVVINHGTSEANRMSVSMPVYYWLSRWFVDRGFAVVLPQRRGHGATGGTLVEAVGDCANPDHFRSGVIAAQDVGAAVDFMTRQPFVDPARVLVVGVSTGGWASLALASQRPGLMTAVVNIAGGRGGHAFGRKNSVCGVDKLVERNARLCAYGAGADAVAVLPRTTATSVPGWPPRWRRPGRKAAARSSSIRCPPMAATGTTSSMIAPGGASGARRWTASSPRTSATRRSRWSRKGRNGPLLSQLGGGRGRSTGSRPPRYSYCFSAVQDLIGRLGLIRRFVAADVGWI